MRRGALCADPPTPQQVIPAGTSRLPAPIHLIGTDPNTPLRSVRGHKLRLFFRDPDRMECEVLVTNPEPGQVPMGAASHLYR